MDTKTKLGNVSFGGNWSEEILADERLDGILSFLDNAAEECAERDMRGPEMEAVLSYLAAHVDKGAILAEALKQALHIADSYQRQQAVLRAVRQIRKSVRW